MKIAVLAFSSIPKMGGAEIFTVNLIQKLQEASHQVDLYLPREFYNKFKRLSLGINVYPIFFRELGFINRFPSILNLMLLTTQKKRKYDLWQVIGAHPAAHCLRMVAENTPVAVRAFGADIQKEESINYGFRLRLNIDEKLRETLSKITHVTALTPSLAEDFKSLGVPESKITEIPNGVDLKRFESSQKVDLKKEYNLSDDEKMILTTGRYHIKKGYEYIPEAVRILSDKGLKFKWIIVGKGLKKIQYLIDEFDVSERLLIKDEIGIAKEADYKNVPGEKLIQLYKSSDIYVLPSLIEGMSNAMLEAMAAGIPVVTTNSPGCRDLVRNNVNGLVCKPKDSKDLAAKIEKLFDDKVLSELKKSVQNYIQTHSWDLVARKYIDLYKGLLR